MTIETSISPPVAVTTGFHTKPPAAWAACRYMTEYVVSF